MDKVKFKEIRKSLGLSQWGIANKLNVSQGSITNWENGYRDIPDEIDRKVQELVENEG